MDKKDIWETNKFAIQWKNKLANKKDNMEKDNYERNLNRWGNVIKVLYFLLVVGWFVWLYNI